MDELNISQLERFKKLGRLFDVDKIITPEEMTQILESIIGILAEFKKETVSLNEESKSVVRHSLDDIQHALDLSISKLESKADDGTSSIKTEYIKAEKILGQLVQSYKNAEVLYDNLVNFKAADGKDGRPGTDGDNGYTPIKGKDYFTEQEKKELVEEISSNVQLDDSKTLREEIEAIKASVKSQTVMVGGRGIADAPRDGKVYGRQNRSWVEVVGGGGGSSTYTGLTDAATADLPTINTPLSNALASKATPADISTAISNLVDTSPTTLDTLNELAAALGDDPNFATTVSTQIGLKEDSANKVTTFTGNTASNTFFPTVKAVYDWAVATFASVTHTHTAAQITDFNTAVSANADVTANTSARHTHANKALLDTYSQTEANLADAVAKKHSHTNIAILDATTASYTTTEQSKLSGIASGAEVNVNPDWNAVSGDAQILNKPTISGSNTGDQTSIVGITGTTAQFNTALTDGDFATLAGTETLTNKRVSKRVQTITSTATLTPSWDTDDNIVITAQAAALTIANPTGTPTQGQTIMVRLKDDGTARAITFGANYRAFVAALPTTTTISKTVYIGLIANTTDSKVDTTAISEV